MSTAKRSIIRIILRHVVCITCVWNSYFSTRSASESLIQLLYYINRGNGDESSAYTIAGQKSREAAT